MNVIVGANVGDDSDDEDEILDLAGEGGVCRLGNGGPSGFDSIIIQSSSFLSCSSSNIVSTGRFFDLVGEGDSSVSEDGEGLLMGMGVGVVVALLMVVRWGNSCR